MPLTEIACGLAPMLSAVLGTIDSGDGSSQYAPFLDEDIASYCKRVCDFSTQMHAIASHQALPNYIIYRMWTASLLFLVFFFAAS